MVFFINFALRQVENTWIFFAKDEMLGEKM